MTWGGERLPLVAHCAIVNSTGVTSMTATLELTAVACDGAARSRGTLSGFQPVGLSVMNRRVRLIFAGCAILAAASMIVAVLHHGSGGQHEHVRSCPIPHPVLGVEMTARPVNRVFHHRQEVPTRVVPINPRPAPASDNFPPTC